MLAFLPILGPLLSGVANIFQTWNQTKMAKDANDLAEVKDRLDAQRKDIRFQLQEDLIVFPIAIWICLFVEGKITEKMYPDLVWPVADLGSLAYIVPIILAYLFGMPIRDKYFR